MNRIKLSVLFCLALTLVAGAAAAEVVTSGVDLWTTPGDGRTFVDFSANPLPAGFFCPGSEPFAGRIVFRGVPIDTRPRDAFGNADTIIERLDDAVFLPQSGREAARTLVREADGRHVEMSFQGHLVATTRVQVRALRFESTRPVVTHCGRFRVTANLTGEQPVTTMIMVRDDANGGRFFAPLSLVTRLTFTPQGGGLALEVAQRIDFPARPDAQWSFRPEANRPNVEGFVRVDTDGDRQVDTFLPGTSNFHAGFKAAGPREGDGNVVGTIPYVPYCDGVDDYWAEHCHGTDPVLEEAAQPLEPILESP